MILSIIIWIVLCIILASAGSKRKIGGAGAFFISLLLSPLIGLIVVLASDKIDAPAIRPINKKANELKEMATKSYKENDYQAALENLKEAIKIDPEISGDYFNLACIYSNLKDSEQGFKQLQKAVEIGYNNFELINETKGLQYLREQKEFEDFALNGYKF